MRKTLLAAMGILAICAVGQRTGAGAGAAGGTYAPREFEAVLAGKGKADVIALAGTPDKMFGVTGEEDVPMNLSAHWVYGSPKTRIVDSATKNPPTSVHIWFDPNDRVERVTFEFGR